jgi:hypothetical protein
MTPIPECPRSIFIVMEMSIGNALTGLIPGGYGGPEQRGLRRPCEIFNKRNGTLRDDGDGAPIVGANAARTATAARTANAARTTDATNTNSGAASAAIAE